MWRVMLLAPGLKPVKVGSVQAGQFGKLILCETPSHAEFLDPNSHNAVNILQTLSVGITMP